VPLDSWREVQGTEQRTWTDWAAFLRTLADTICPLAERNVVIEDNLKTYGPVEQAWSDLGLRGVPDLRSPPVGRALRISSTRL